MQFKKVKKLRKGLLIAVVAGVVVSQAAPAIHSGTRAYADDQSDAEETSVILQANEDEEKILAEKKAEADLLLKTSSEDGKADGASSGKKGNEADAQSGKTDAASGEGSGATSSGEDSDGADTQPGKTDAASGETSEVTSPGEDSGAADAQTGETDAEPGEDSEATSPGEDSGVADTQTGETDAASGKASGDAQKTDAAQTEETADTDSVLKAAIEAQSENEAVAQELAENPANAPASYEQDTTWYPVPDGELVPSPVIYRGFRFWTVAKDYAFAAADINILEEMKASARAVGSLKKDALCYVLKSEDGWYYVESGTVRGFVKADDVVAGEKAEGLKAVYNSEAEVLSSASGTEESIDTVAPLAEQLVSKEDNAAFDYYRATVYQTVVEKDYALPAAGMVNIREDAADGSRVVGVLASNGICYVITDRDSDWVYVESGDVRGFVKQEQLVMADTAGDDSILTKEEEDYATASESVKPEENRALYYTMTSIRSGVPDGMERSSILQYASEFIGNPYVWGGTSLTSGADCSGFVQSIFAQYGYSLPRTAAEQSQVGEQIAVEDAQPGDLIFYGRGGHIYHVVIYAGDGQTIEAKSRRAGIVASEVSYKNAVWAVRILDENQATQFDIPDGLGSVHSYMGWQKVTMKGSQQYAFRESAGMAFDPEGFGVVDNRYVIACTTTFGNIGDYVDFYQEDGSVIPCIIGDFKNQNDAGCNAYGHLNGNCIVEFVVDQNSWYRSGHANPGTASCHPEWDQDIVKAVNVGSFYD